MSTPTWHTARLVYEERRTEIEEGMSCGEG